MIRVTKYTVATLLLLLLALPATACFGPKLYLGTPAGQDGELLFHLVAIYVHEKTGVESLRFDFIDDQAGLELLKGEKVDLVFAPSASQDFPTLLQTGSELFLLSGTRPTDDLQFTTVPRALGKLQSLLKIDDLSLLRKLVATGTLPAKAVRSLYMQRGWI